MKDQIRRTVVCLKNGEEAGIFGHLQFIVLNAGTTPCSAFEIEKAIVLVYLTLTEDRSSVQGSTSISRGISMQDRSSAHICSLPDSGEVCCVRE
jgi:hypothetical protein